MILNILKFLKILPSLRIQNKRKLIPQKKEDVLEGISLKKRNLVGKDECKEWKKDSF